MTEPACSALPWTTPQLEDLTEKLTTVAGGLGSFNDGTIEAILS